jgi:hypothetical protein
VVKDIEQQSFDRKRSFIVRAIFGLYVAGVALVVPCLFYRGANYADETFVDISEAVNLAVLSVLVLVIFFATKISGKA